MQNRSPDAAVAPLAVSLLRKLGACDDYIAMGYAAAGNIEDAEKLRNQRGVRLKPLAIGAAMCADTGYAEKLRYQFNYLPSGLYTGQRWPKIMVMLRHSQLTSIRKMIHINSSKSHN